MNGTVIREGSKFIGRITFEFRNKTYSHQKTFVSRYEAEDFVKSIINNDKFENKMLFEVCMMIYNEYEKKYKPISMHNIFTPIYKLKPLWTIKVKDFKYKVYQDFVNETNLIQQDRMFVNKLIRKIQKEYPTFKNFIPFIIYKKTRE